jgi:hypothetical protein
MAVFIKKENLGSGPGRPDTFRVRKGELKGGVSFGVMADAFNKAKEAKKAALEQKYEGNAERQRWHTLTKEEKARDAIDRMIPTTKAIEEMRNGGKEVSADEARRAAEKIAYKSDRIKEE